MTKFAKIDTHNTSMAIEPNAREAGMSNAFGHYLVEGSQDVTLADPDAMRTVCAEPDLSIARSAFDEAMVTAEASINSLDFSNQQAANSSMGSLFAIFDGARRAADRPLTRQYNEEMHKIDRREASWNGVKAQLEGELAILEAELEGVQQAN